jgi:aminoglycoside N3'-acetyltransferase
MQEVNKTQIVEILKQVGVGVGDGLLVHSALQFLGRPEGGIGIYLEALQEVVGQQGTLVVPTFNFSFAKGEDYDPAAVPAVGMGISLNLCACRQPCCAPATRCSLLQFGDDGSAAARMLELDFKLLLLGTDIQAASILHYSEQRAEVPYRYWKEFNGKVMRGDQWQPASYKMFVRDMEIDARLEIYAIQDVLEEEGNWAQAKLNYGWISLCSLKDFVRITDDLLAKDPWCFVTNRPEGA